MLSSSSPQSDKVMGRISEFLKISKSCNDYFTPCFQTGNIANLTQLGSVTINYRSARSVILADGFSLGFDYV